MNTEPNENQNVETNVFVRMSEAARIILILVSVGLIFLKGILYMMGNTEGWVLIYITSSVMTLIYLFPILAFKNSYGWLHIVVIFLVRYLISEFMDLKYVGHPHQPHQVLEGWGQVEMAWVFIKMNMLYIISVIATYVGFFFFGRVKKKPIKFREFSGFQSKLTIVMVVCVLLFIAFITLQGGITNWLLYYWGGGRARAVASGEVAPGLWMILIRFSVFAVLFWFARDKMCLLKPRFWVFAIVSIAMVFFINGSRSTVIGFGVYGLIVWMLRENKVAPFRLVIFGLIAVLAVSVLGEFRRSTWKGSVDWDSLSNFDVSEKFQGGIDEVNTRGVSKNGEVAIVALVPDELDMLYGKSYLSLLLAPVPRALFPSKPQGAGKELGSKLFGIRGGVPAGALGEAYWNFHVFGIVLIYILFGAFYRWFVSLLEVNPREPTLWIIYALIIYIFKNPAILGFIYIMQQAVSVVLLYYFFSYRRN